MFVKSVTKVANQIGMLKKVGACMSKNLLDG